MTMRTETSHRWIAALIWLALMAPAAAAEAPDPVATVDAFAAALAAGDEATVKKLLAPDVLIYESGGQESSRDEYAAHHMKADMGFLAHSQAQQLGRTHTVQGELAVVSTRSRLTGTHEGKPFDLLSTETLVLRRGADGWRIAHIHWSSRPAPKGK